MTDKPDDPIEADYHKMMAEGVQMLEDHEPSSVWAHNYINMAKEIRALRRLCLKVLPWIDCWDEDETELKEIEDKLRAAAAGKEVALE